jgi:hypothetical protein
MATVKTPDARGGRTTMADINQLYTYFGCKKAMLSELWDYWGPGCDVLVEPFAGTAVATLNCPYRIHKIYLNDFDCHVANVLRSVVYEPETVIDHACHPRIELDLHMIHDYLTGIRPGLRDTLMSGIEAHDAKLAGWWVWGCNNWLGGGWCSDNRILKTPDALAVASQSPAGTCRKKPNKNQQLTERQIVATPRKKPNDRNKLTERLVATERKKPNTGNRLTERLAPDRRAHVSELVYRCYDHLRDAKILYGDFARCLTNSYLEGSRMAILLDPPYPGTDCEYTDDDAFARRGVDIAEGCREALCYLYSYFFRHVWQGLKSMRD